jgi:hypothetical protein
MYENYSCAAEETADAGAGDLHSKKPEKIARNCF